MHQLVGSFFNRHAVADLRPLQLLVDMWFQVYFTPLTGVLFTFPSRYLFTIDLKKYVALPVSSGEFTRAFRVSSYSRTTAIESLRFRVRDYYPVASSFPARSTNSAIFYSTPYFRKDSCSLITPIHSITRRTFVRNVIEWLSLCSSRFARRY